MNHLLGKSKPMCLLLIISGMLVGCDSDQHDNEQSWVATLKEGRAITAHLATPRGTYGRLEGDDAEKARRFLLTVLEWSSTRDTTILTEMPAGDPTGYIILEIETNPGNVERVGLSLFPDSHFVLLNRMLIKTSLEDETAIRDFILNSLENGVDGE